VRRMPTSNLGDDTATPSRNYEPRTIKHTSGFTATLPSHSPYGRHTSNKGHLSALRYLAAGAYSRGGLPSHRAAIASMSGNVGSELVHSAREWRIIAAWTWSESVDADLQR
jgi:hypothetical protein